MQTVLSIAGFDPSSGAGVTADLKTFAAHKLFATTCITALTVQSTLGVRSTHPTPASVVAATLDCLQADLPPSGIKIGMLATKDIVNEICNYLNKVKLSDKENGGPVIVLDPILRSSSGKELLDPEALSTVCDRLLPLVDWVTPNLSELSILAGVEVSRREDLPHASCALQDRVAQSFGRRIGIFATGGHLDPPDDFLLLPTGEAHWLAGQHIVSRATHGTGCALSSAFLSRLLLQDAPQQAAQSAKAYVAKSILSAEGIGKGYSSINHLWTLL
jgi:hydroxymethylpyrimidine/phosphomethylpyrimidine kinase